MHACMHTYTHTHTHTHTCMAPAPRLPPLSPAATDDGRAAAAAHKRVRWHSRQAEGCTPSFRTLLAGAEERVVPACKARRDPVCKARRVPACKARRVPRQTTLRQKSKVPRRYGEGGGGGRKWGGGYPSAQLMHRLPVYRCRTESVFSQSHTAGAGMPPRPACLPTYGYIRTRTRTRRTLPIAPAVVRL